MKKLGHPFEFYSFPYQNTKKYLVLGTSLNLENKTSDEQQHMTYDTVIIYLTKIKCRSHGWQS